MFDNVIGVMSDWGDFDDDGVVSRYFSRESRLGDEEK